MSQYFNLARFGRLLRKHFAEHASSYGLSATVLLGGLLALLGFLCYVGSHAGGLVAGEQSAVFLLALLGAGAYFASTVLAGYGHGSRAAQALTLPAAQLEKFLLAWLVSVPGFLVVFAATFYLADWLVLTLGNDPNPVFNVLENAQGAKELLAYFLLLHGVALWGSIAFRRQQFVRTGFVLFAAAVVLGVANTQALRALLGTRVMGLPFGLAHLNGGPSLGLPDSQMQWLGWLPVALALLLWPAAYARLTEKQL